MQAEDTTRDEAAAASKKLVCPFCRFENDAGVDRCADCGARLDVKSEVPVIDEVPALPGAQGAPAASVPGQAPPAQGLPPRRIAVPFKEELSDAGFAICPSCGAKNLPDCLRCARCARAIAPPGPASGEAIVATGAPHTVGVPGVLVAGDAEKKDDTCVGRVAREDQFVPERLAREREAQRQRELDERARAVVVARGAPRERASAAITSGLVYGVATTLLLPFVSEHALELAPINFVLGALAGANIAAWPSASSGAGSFLAAAFLTVFMAQIGSPLIVMGFLVFATCAGSYAAHVLADRRSVKARQRPEGERPDAPERRHRLFEIEIARLRAVLTGGTLLGAAWAPASLFSREGLSRAVFNQIAIALGCFAVIHLIKSLGQEARETRRSKLRALVTRNFMVVAVVLFGLSIAHSPLLGLVGVALTFAAMRAFELGLPRYFADALATPEEEGVADR